MRPLLQILLFKVDLINDSSLSLNIVLLIYTNAIFLFSFIVWSADKYLELFNIKAESGHRIQWDKTNNICTKRHPPERLIWHSKYTVVAIHVSDITETHSMSLITILNLPKYKFYCTNEYCFWSLKSTNFHLLITLFAEARWSLIITEQTL